MPVTLEQIKSLRERTGVSTMACKKALEEANSDENKAIEILRKKGEAKAVERADKATSNGVIAVAEQAGKAALIALACETDFVAKNEDFINTSKALAQKLLKEGENADLSKELAEQSFKLGEKVEVKDKKVLSGDHLASYVHLNNRIGVLVSLTGGDESLGKDIAMHVAAMNPSCISPDEVSRDLLAKEKEIWSEELKKEGKPAEILEKIILGKEKKFREELALLTEPFVKNPDQTVKDLLGTVEVSSFVRFEL